jgi:hypothetical protein
MHERRAALHSAPQRLPTHSGGDAPSPLPYSLCSQELFYQGDSDADLAAVLELSRREVEQLRPSHPSGVSVSTLKLKLPERSAQPAAEAAEEGFHSARTQHTGFESARSNLNAGLYSARSTAISRPGPSHQVREHVTWVVASPRAQTARQPSLEGGKAYFGLSCYLLRCRLDFTHISPFLPCTKLTVPPQVGAQGPSAASARMSKSPSPPAYTPPWFGRNGVSPVVSPEVARQGSPEIDSEGDEFQDVGSDDDDFKSVRPRAVGKLCVVPAGALPAPVSDS